MSADAGEGITFAVPPLAPSGLCAFAEGGSCRRGGAAAVAEGEEHQLPPPPPGSFWNVESAAAPVTECPAAASGSSAARCRGNSGGGGGRRTTVAYVINEESQGQQVVAESEALQCLREACETVGATLETLHFGKLDFGETTVLDRFYNAGAYGPSPHPPRPGAAAGASRRLYFLPHPGGSERQCATAPGRVGAGARVSVSGRQSDRLAEPCGPRGPRAELLGISSRRLFLHSASWFLFSRFGPYSPSLSTCACFR